MRDKGLGRGGSASIGCRVAQRVARFFSIALLAFFAGCRPLCDGASEACIVLDLLGGGQFAGLEAEWSFADSNARSSRRGAIEGAFELPRSLTTQTPPGTPPQSLRTLTLVGTARDRCTLSHDELACDRAAAAILFNGESFLDGTTGVPLTVGDQLRLTVKPFVFRSGEVSGLQGPYTQVLAQDLDGDGMPELVVTYADLQLALLRRDAAGGFVEYDRPLRTAAPAKSLLADWNSDGRLDLIVGEGRILRVLVGRGDGLFDPPLQLDAGWAIGGFFVGDFDGVPPADLIASEASSCGPAANCRVPPYAYALWRNNQTTQAVYNLPQIATGMFPGPMCGQLFTPQDVNRDGLLDIVFHDDATNSVRVALGSTASPLANLTDWPELGALSICGIREIGLTADRNDLIAGLCDEPHGIMVFVGAKLGQPLRSAGHYLRSQTPEDRYGSLNVADFTGDGRPDLALTNSMLHHHVALVAGHLDGTLLPPVLYEVAERATGLVTADLNHDGRPDLLVIHEGSPRLSILYNHAR